MRDGLKLGIVPRSVTTENNRQTVVSRHDRVRAKDWAPGTGVVAPRFALAIVGRSSVPVRRTGRKTGTR